MKYNKIICKLTEDGIPQSYRTGLEPRDNFVFTKSDILLT